MRPERCRECGLTGRLTTRPAPTSVCPKAINPGVAGAKPPSISFLFRIDKHTAPRSCGLGYPFLLSWPCDMFCLSGGRALQHLANKVRSEEHTSELQSLRHLVC